MAALQNLPCVPLDVLKMGVGKSAGDLRKSCKQLAGCFPQVCVYVYVCVYVCVCCEAIVTCFSSMAYVHACAQNKLALVANAVPWVCPCILRAELLYALCDSQLSEPTSFPFLSFVSVSCLSGVLLPLPCLSEDLMCVCPSFLSWF